MTPVDKNGEPLDAILRRAMRSQPGPATPECADPESVAAYSDRSLSARERERLETHFADCARCQMLLADIARADESARHCKVGGRGPVVSTMAHRDSSAGRGRGRPRLHFDPASRKRSAAE